ncbi:DNA cytosine methyltransferase [Helicobacter pylori]|uniref:DNA cytosine methyltransferase n=1 Tax=Helicobacter pylori TaxID=210 RepID=UPI0009BC7788|nr:DNA cytosine methyltransferase [Helicobacter pylori]AQM66072.1 Modification methylase HhaI [Helicobacter pylori SS1]AQM72524.1 Modification methylase HhaI [Helicobacter pylori PMSS1]UZO85267.1 DNA cytosine methyltransferase [Helicobacter pylori]VTT96133.1 type II R-M system methyltransferase [Helicobacter pylori PMSS1]VTT96169.1 type II R-M system methyltransferase [Helicobacter pylori PMSS1]
MEILTFMDFCSGIGGGRLGLEQCHLKCVGHAEINHEALRTYELFFKDTHNFGDLMRINPNDLPDFDALVSGFPCQAFSINGKRKGLKDERGTIIYGLIRILKVKQPKCFLLENVKGLINHNKKATFNIIIKALQEAGYTTCYQILNSADFQLAQNRERIYIVGFRKDLKHQFNFPLGLANDYHFEDFLDADNECYLDINNATFQKYLHNKYNHNRVFLENILTLENAVLDTRQSDLRLYFNVFPTLRTSRHGLFYTQKGKIKKLNAIESLLLQGFPRDLIAKIKNNPNFKESHLLSQAGNAMSVNVIAAIAKQMLKAVSNE